MMEQTIFDRFYGGTTNPGDSERINFDGPFYATSGYFTNEGNFGDSIIAGTNITATNDMYFDGANRLTGAGTGQTYTFPNGSATVGIARNSGDSYTGAVYYNGRTRTPRNFYGGTQIPSNDTTAYRLNYDGHFYATKGYFTTVTTTGSVVSTGNIYFDNSNILTGAGTGQTYTFPNGTGTVGIARTSGNANTGAVFYNGTTRSAGNFYGGALLEPNGTTRLNYNGYFYATRGYFTNMYSTGNIYFDGSNVLTGVGTSQTYTFPNGTGIVGIARTPNADTNVGAVKYNGITRTVGNFYGGTQIPTNNTTTYRLNYDGRFYAYSGYFTTVTTTGAISATTTITAGGNIYFDSSNILTGAGTGQTYTFPNGTGTVGIARTSGDPYTGAVYYNGTTRVSGNFYGGALLEPNGTTRLNYSGYFYATRGNFANTITAGTTISAGTTVTAGGNIYFDSSNILTGEGASYTYTFPNTSGTVGIARNSTNSYVGAVKYNAHTRTPGNFYGGSVNGPTNVADAYRLNYDGRFYASYGNFTTTITAGTSISAATTITAGGNIYFDGANILTGGGTGQTYTFPNGTGTVGIARNSTNNHVGAVKYNGHTRTPGNFYGGTLSPTNDAPITYRLNYDGHFYATKVFNPVWGDVAEFMEKDSDEAVPGDVLVQGENGLKPSEFRADPRIVGVYSDSFGYALSAKEQEDKYPVGLTGIVRVKVKEALKIGDLLVSDESGFATKAIESERMPGLILGKVLENKNSEKISRIKMLIM